VRQSSHPRHPRNPRLSSCPIEFAVIREIRGLRTPFPAPVSSFFPFGSIRICFDHNSRSERRCWGTHIVAGLRSPISSFEFRIFRSAGPSMQQRNFATMYPNPCRLAQISTRLAVKNPHPSASSAKSAVNPRDFLRAAIVRIIPSLRASSKPSFHRHEFHLFGGKVHCGDFLRKPASVTTMGI